MSQPPKKKSNPGNANRPTQGGNQYGSSKSSRPVQSQPGGGRPPVTRQPIGKGGRPVQPEKSGFMASVDRVLPPFSAQRYVAIWVLGMIPLILVILLLTQTFKASTPATAQATPTVAAGITGSNDNASGATTPAPQPATGGQNTPSITESNSKQSLSGPGKYMTIDTVKGKIVCKLYTDPEAGVSKTIANFEAKAKAGYFNGLIFHRVEDWVIQGGDPKGTGSGGGDMPSEYNKITFGAGALGIARGGDPAINNDSQFFITKAAASSLDGQYTNWGQVVEGMDVVEKIAIGDKINTLTIEDRQQ